MLGLWLQLMKIMSWVHKIILTLWFAYRMMKLLKLNMNSSRAVEGMAR